MLHCGDTVGSMASCDGDAMIDPMELAYHAARTNNADDYDVAAYAIGYLEPNYPMPAIRYPVVITDWSVVIGFYDDDGPIFFKD